MICINICIAFDVSAPFVLIGRNSDAFHERERHCRITEAYLCFCALFSFDRRGEVEAEHHDHQPTTSIIIIIIIQTSAVSCFYLCFAPTTMKLCAVTTLLLALLVGAAMALFKPARPVQVASKNNANTAAFVSAAGLLDNPLVESDSNITPARKCTYQHCYSDCFASGDAASHT